MSIILRNAELSELQKKRAPNSPTVLGHEKKCQFIQCTATIRVQDVIRTEKKTGKESTITQLCLCLENNVFDEDQGQKNEAFLNLTSDLVFMKYTEKSQSVGFIFYSPIEDKAFLLET